MTTGVSVEDEFCHVDHMVSENAWRMATNRPDTLGRLDDSSWRVLTSALRQGEHVAYSMNARGFILIQDTRDRSEFFGQPAKVFLWGVPALG